jgi:hypothetical protein
VISYRNVRMVEANSWPFVDYSDHNNISEKGAASVRLVLTDEGIGPARIETFELWWRGKPMSTPTELLKAGCTSDSGQHQSGVVLSLQLASPRILRAGEHTDLLSLNADTTNPVWQKLNRERDYIRTRICYCSVFDECWIKEGGAGLLQKGQSKLIHPESVKICPTPEAPYQVSLTTS